MAQLIRATLLKVWFMELDWSVVRKENSKIKKRIQKISQVFGRVIFYLLNLIIKTRGLFIFGKNSLKLKFSRAPISGSNEIEISFLVELSPAQNLLST